MRTPCLVGNLLLQNRGFDGIVLLENWGTFKQEVIQRGHFLEFGDRASLIHRYTGCSHYKGQLLPFFGVNTGG